MTKRGKGFIVGIAALGLALWSLGSDADAVLPVQLTVGSVSEPGDLDLSGTYDDVAARIDALGTVGASARVALPVPGLEEFGPFSSNVTVDAATHSITFDAVDDSLGTTGPAGATSAGLVLDWDDDVDGNASVALVLRDVTATALSDLVPGWSGDDIGLTAADLVLSPADDEFAGAGLDPAARALLGLDDDDLLPVITGVTLSAVYERGSVTAIDELLDGVGASTAADVPVRGPLSGDAATPDPDAVAVDVIAPGIPVADWMDARSVAARVTSTATDRVDSVTIGATTFGREVPLGDSATTFSLTTDSFTPPFGLDGLLGGLTLTDVELSLTATDTTVSGSLRFTLPIGDGVTTEVLLETDGDRGAGTLALEEQVGLGELTAWLATRPGFDGLDTGVPTDELDRVQLTTGEISFSSSSAGSTFTVFADASLALAGDPVGFEVLVSVNAPTGGTPQLLLSLRSAAGTTLGDVLPVPDGAIADLVLPRFTVLAALPDAFEVDQAALGARALAYLDDVYGGELDDPISIASGFLLRAEVDVATLGQDVIDALGWDPDGTIVLEGQIGIDFGALFGPPEGTDPALTSLDLSASIPNGAGPTWLPDFVDWPQGGEWTLAISYAAGGEYSFTAGLSGATVTLPGDSSSFTVDLSAAFTKTPDALQVDLSAAVSDWDQPYGVEWLTVVGASLDVSIVKPTGAPVEASVGFAGQVDIGDESLEVEIDLGSGADGTSVRIRIGLLSTVTVNDVASALGADLGDYSAILGSLGFGPGDLIVTVDDGWSVEAVVRVSWDPYGTGNEADEIAAKLWLNVAKPATVQGSPPPALRVGVGIQPDEDLTLGSFLPPDIDVPVDFALAEGDDPDTPEDESYTIGLVYTNTVFDPADLDDDSITKAWFAPLFADGENSRVTAGVGVYGAIPLPDAVAPLLSELGVSDEVQLKGRLPIGAGAPMSGLSLSLGMRLDPAALPPTIHGAGLSLAVSLDDGEIAVSLTGEMTFAIEQGLRGDAATALADIGVDPLVPVAADATCPRGGVVKLVGSEYYCHDLLTLAVSAELAAGADGLSLTLIGDLYAGDAGARDPESVWKPLGLDWIGFRQMILTLGIEVDATGPSIDFGIAANVEVAGKSLSGALSIGLAPLPNPPFIRPEFNGIRFEAPGGLMFGDVVSLANTITGSSFTPASLDLPDIGLRNLAFSLSPLGVTELCIPQGLRIQADLYINPTGASAVAPQCDPLTGIAERPNPSTSCAARRDEGCFAGILLDISDQGIIGQGSVAGFDIGPISWKGGQIDLRLTTSEQSLLVEGAADITVGDAVLVDGELKLKFDKTTFEFYGAMTTLNGALNVLADGAASIDVFNDENPAGLRLHVLVATSSAKIGDPSLGQALIDSVTADLQKLNTLVDGLDSLLVQWERAGGGATQLITELPAILRGMGITVPQWVADVSNTIKEIDKADTFNVVNGLFDAALNGVTITFPKVCFGELGCIQADPITIPGLCSAVFPQAKGPNGRCTIPGVARAYIVPLFRTAINGTISGLESLDGAQLDQALKAVFDGIGKVVRLDCAEFFVDLGPSATNTFALAVNGAVFGEPVGFGIDITPSDFTGLSGRVDEMLLQVFENITSGSSLPACGGYRADLFGVGQADPEAPIVPNVIVLPASEAVNEGSAATVEVSFQGPVTAARPLTLNWGDGTVETVSVGATPARFSHVYGDDDPTGTNTDAYTVTVTDPQTSRADSDTLAVVNVAPTVTASFADAVDEAATVAVDVTVTDPGSDSHTVLLTWGDGSTSSATMPEGVKAGTTVRLTHVYEDDNPSGTAEDVVLASVSVLDDDLGQAFTDASVTVRNVAPVVSAGADVTLQEAGTVDLSVSFTDVGTLDTHGYVVDWGDGNRTPLIEAPASRQFSASHTYGDDGVFTITVTVADDDTGVGVDTVIATVGNVAPTLAIAEPVDGRSWILADGIDTDTRIDLPTLLTVEDVPATLRARSTDPGSDDLTFLWTWGDGTSTTTTYRSDPSRVDPDPSTELNRRDVTDAPAKVWADPCLYQVDATVADDDGGSATDRTWVVVTGTPKRQIGAGSWAASLDGKGSLKLSAAQTSCYLRAVDHLSTTFGAPADLRPLVTVADAVAILNPGGGPADQLAQLDRALLVSWLELVNGGVTWNQQVDTNGDRIPDATFGSLVRAAETVRANPTATPADRTEARRLLSRAVQL